MMETRSRLQRDMLGTASHTFSKFDFVASMLLKYEANPRKRKLPQSLQRRFWSRESWTMWSSWKMLAQKNTDDFWQLSNIEDVILAMNC